MDSIHDKLSRVRKPRVHITYDIETEGAQEKRELPFVVGVMGDFAGASENVKTLKERRFVQVDQDNFDDVMQKMGPRIKLKVANELADGATDIGVDLRFNSMRDFEPAAIAAQVEPLRRLMETRNQLRDLMTKVDRSEDLEALLEQVLNNSADLQILHAQTKAEGDGA